MTKEKNLSFPIWATVLLFLVAGLLLLGNVVQFWYTYNVALPTAERANQTAHGEEMLLNNLSKRVMTLEKKAGLR